MGNREERNEYATAKWDAEEVRRQASSEQRRHSDRRRQAKRNRTIIYLACVVLVSCLLAGIGWLLVNDVCSLNKPYTEVEITVEEGDSRGDVAKKLHDAGLVNSRLVFNIAGTFLHYNRYVEPGTYKLNSDMDFRALTVANVARRRPLKLGDGMRLLIFGEVDGDKGFFTAKQGVGQCERSFGFTDAAGAGQQEYPLRAVLRREAGFSRPQPLCDGAERRALPDNAVFKALFHTEQVALLVPEQGRERDAGPVRHHSGDGAGVHIQCQQRCKALMCSQLLLQFSAVCPFLTQRHNLLRKPLFLLILRFQMPGFCL